MVGVHAPEFPREKEPANVRKNVRDLEVAYPVVLDNDFKMWDALGNRYWPTLYLVDAEGVIRRVHAGEMHLGSEDSRAFRMEMERLLAARKGG